MATVHITKGILAGLDLEVLDQAGLSEFAHSDRSELSKISFYRGEVKRVVFRGVNLIECSFAWTTFEGVTFRRCIFRRVDLTRVKFIGCHFSECQFRDCDPYHPSFSRTVIAPASFKDCYSQVNWNKALILFEKLKLGFENAGNGRSARAAEYYYRVWERRRLYHLWRDRETSGPLPWVGSLFLGSLTGYGERPAYLGLWMFGLITLMSFVYMHWFPFAIVQANAGFADFWYFSFKVFFAQGLLSQF